MCSNLHEAYLSVSSLRGYMMHCIVEDAKRIELFPKIAIYLYIKIYMMRIDLLQF